MIGEELTLFVESCSCLQLASESWLVQKQLILLNSLPINLQQGYLVPIVYHRLVTSQYCLIVSCAME